MDDFRDAMVARVQGWTGADDPYNEIDELINDLDDAGWEIVEADPVLKRHLIVDAALALAGAELAGTHREQAWTQLESVLAAAFGDNWMDAAEYAFNSLVSYPEAE